MLRRPPTILQLTQDDITAYETSRNERAQRAAQTRKAEEQLQQQTDRYIQAQHQAQMQQYSHQHQHMQSEEGDTEPDPSEDEDEMEDEEELDDSHLASRRPAAPTRAEQQPRHLQHPPPQFRMPRSIADQPRQEQPRDASDEEMQDLDTPTAPFQAAAAARRDRRHKAPATASVGVGQTMDGTADAPSSRVTTMSREERERRARARIMGATAASSGTQPSSRSMAAERSGARAWDR